MLNLFLFLFLGTLGWGVSLYLIKILLVSLTPTEIVLYRALIGAFSLLILASLLRLKPGNLKDLARDGLVVGLFNMALPFYLTSLAEKSVSSALASVLNGLTPLCAFVLSLCFFRDKPKFSGLNFLSLSLGLLGIVLVNLDALEGQGSVWHLLALVATCFSYALAANYVKSCARSKEPILVAIVATASSSLLMLAFELYSSPVLFSWGYPGTLAQLGSLLWLGLVGTGLSLYLYCLLISRVGAVTASMTTYLMTLTGVLMGVLFLGERMSSLVILGCFCVITSLVTTNHSAALERLFSSFIAPRPAQSAE